MSTIDAVVARRILIVFDTRFGQSAEIARYVEKRLVGRGQLVDVEQAPGARSIPIEDYAGAVVIAPVYNRRHTESIERFVREYASALGQLPTAFISVSLGAVARSRLLRASVRRVSRRLFEAHHWYPAHVLHAGGSLDYPIYGPTTRRWLRAIALVFGLPRDTTRRHELTSWSDIDVIIDALVEDLQGSFQPRSIGGKTPSL